TPGVARVVNAIVEEPQRAWELTGLGRSVGIFTNGTRVLGLGDVGWTASLPVMEGKAVLDDVLGGLSATPILVATKGPDVLTAPGAGAPRASGPSHLETSRPPDC